jgi:hypothetical protein
MDGGTDCDRYETVFAGASRFSLLRSTPISNASFDRKRTGQILVAAVLARKCIRYAILRLKINHQGYTWAMPWPDSLCLSALRYTVKRFPNDFRLVASQIKRHSDPDPEMIEVGHDTLVVISVLNPACDQHSLSPQIQ